MYLSVYAWLQLLLPDISFWGLLVFYVLLVFSSLFTFLGSFLPPSLRLQGTSWLGRLGEYWMGIYFYLFSFILIKDIFIGLGTFFTIFPNPLPVNTKIILGFLIFISLCILLLYGRSHAKMIKTTTYSISLDHKKVAKELNIVLLSDLHLGYTNGTSYVSKLVDQINHLQPDIVLIAGDIINGDFYAINDPNTMHSLFKKITSTYGTYACLGNHDAGKSYPEMTTFLEACDIQVLYDEAIVIDASFVLMGRRDKSPIGNHGSQRISTEKLLSNLCKDLPIIVIDHQPDTITQYHQDVDLILSGHTHQGQIFPFNLVTKALFTVDYGYYQKDKNSPQVIVTSGCGTWGPPLRIGTCSEVVQIFIKNNLQ